MEEVDDRTAFEIAVPVAKRAAVLAALYNATKPVGMGLIHYRPEPMTEVQAQALIYTYQANVADYPRLAAGYRCDYVHGRPIKIHFDDDLCRGLHLYDRYQGGTGAARRIIEYVLTGWHQDQGEWFRDVDGVNVGHIRLVAGKYQWFAPGPTGSMGEAGDADTLPEARTQCDAAQASL